MTTIQLKKRIESHISHFDVKHLEALLRLVEIMDKDRQEEEDFVLSKTELQIIDGRMNELLSGKVKGVDAYEVIRAGKATLKRKQKSK